VALTDPQKVTFGGEKTLPRVSTQGHSSTYQTEDGLVRETFSSQEGKRKRHVARIDVEKTTSDPIVPTQNTIASMSAYLVVDRPITGYTATEAYELAKGLIAQLEASTGAVLKKVIGGES
jgi:hypothetical protein